MLKPKHTITNTILRYLTEIAEARAVILSAPLIPKWEIDLRREALLRSTHASTSIEGNRLSYDEVSDLMIGRDITALARDKQEVLNYFEALRALDKMTKEKKPHLSGKDILRLHRIITKNVMEDGSASGRYRQGNEYVFVGNRITGEVTFKPPPTPQVPLLVENLVNWINSKDTEQINPVIEAGISHYELVRIHPFLDGNGRTARALATLILLRRNFDTKRFFALDDYYNSNRGLYYQALKTVDPKSLDLTAWLEYFSQGVAVSIKAVQEKVLSLSKGKTKNADGRQIALDDRQVRLVELARKEGRVTNRQAQQLLGISNKTAYALLTSLTKAGVLKKEGSGRSVIYTVGND